MKILLATAPPLDPTKPPAIFSILGSCCDTVGWNHEIYDINLTIYKTFDQDDALQLVNDLTAGAFRSDKNRQNYDLICSKFIDAINEYCPDIVALSVFTYISQFATKYLLEKINQSNRNFKILIGGLGITTNQYSCKNSLPFSDFCLQNQLIDFYIHGEGEIAFMELLKGNHTYPGINNKNNIRIDDLDSLPMPSYKKLNLHDYFHGSEPKSLINGSRGCVRDCTFCDVGHYWDKYVYKSGNRIAQEILEIYLDNGIQNFDFTDSLINGSISSFRQLNKELIRLKNLYPDFKPKYQGQFICRPVGQLKAEDYEQMALAGADVLVVGIESFSNSVRHHMRKKFSNEDIDYHFELCAKYKIKNVLLLLSGYPTESLDDHLINLEYLKKYQMYALSRTIYAINMEPQGLFLLPKSGVPLNNMEQELQIVYSHHNDNNITDWISLSNPNLTKKERFRRGVEIMYTAYSLGYKILHINQKIDAIEQQAKVYIK